MASSSETEGSPVPPNNTGLDLWWKYRTNGQYDAIVDLINDLRESFLGNVIYNQHLVWSRARFGGNHMYRRRDASISVQF
ncbi:hypothetical protein EST38_g12614 [Candolleomyces aberdarensis]|uniref:Uncharacterized protein n=1 Tax=Candolleomyces aberdarensis TaxID=2316362 RepID=A0A4Q2D344_9AGAR|nr:hypothetical protein EST38_g12614 [Candolleomyces aberdarensis]